MADHGITLGPVPALGGADITIGQNHIVERTGLALVSVATPLGGGAELSGALSAGWGLDLPKGTKSHASDEVRAIPLTADQCLLIREASEPDPVTIVREKLKGTGYTTDQTDAWVCLEISGPETILALERLCPLDVARFEDGTAARTVMQHMGALIIRLSPDRFLLLSARSSAASFLHAVETSYRNVT